MKINFLDKLNSYSWVHLFGCYGLSLTLFLVFPVYIWWVTGFVWILGLFNELFFDGHFESLGIFDKRGGDYWDIIWNTIGIVCALILWSIIW